MSRCCCRCRSWCCCRPARGAPVPCFSSSGRLPRAPPLPALPLPNPALPSSFLNPSRAQAGSTWPSRWRAASRWAPWTARCRSRRARSSRSRVSLRPFFCSLLRAVFLCYNSIDARCSALAARAAAPKQAAEPRAPRAGRCSSAERALASASHAPSPHQRLQGRLPSSMRIPLPPFRRLPHHQVLRGEQGGPRGVWRRPRLGLPGRLCHRALVGAAAAARGARRALGAPGGRLALDGRCRGLPRRAGRSPCATPARPRLRFLLLSFAPLSTFSPLLPLPLPPSYPLIPPFPGARAGGRDGVGGSLRGPRRRHLPGHRRGAPKCC